MESDFIAFHDPRHRGAPPRGVHHEGTAHHLGRRRHCRRRYRRNRRGHTPYSNRPHPKNPPEAFQCTRSASRTREFVPPDVILLVRMKLLTLFVLSLGLGGGLALAASPCTTVAGCTEWVALPDAPARSLIYRTHSLDLPNPAISRALIVIHGTGRDADNYFRTALAATFLAGALEDTAVIVPRIASAAAICRDVLAPNEFSWSCNGDSWRSGGTSR